jgi:ATP-dependent RNA helicase DeaD
MTSHIERFDELGLSSPLLRALEDIGYEKPSPIQAECIPVLMTGQDLLGQAQTGTGKTAAFALPLLEKLDLAQKKPQVLVLTPTRELSIQVAEAFQSYSKYLPGFHVLPLYGGQSMVNQLRQLDRGAQVIVGTPGRVMDHLERKSLVLDNLKTLVLDEADEMLRMGFIDDVEWILEHTPASRQTALFSATMPEAIRRVAQGHLRTPLEVKIKSSTSTVQTIRQRYWQVSGLHKLDALTRILEVEPDFDAAIIFVRTKTATVELAEKLEARGYAAAALNGDMQQPMRERVIDQLKNKKLDIVVATDVAARGIDVARVSHVINYDIPYDTEAYVHRIGRTGRAGRQGTAILFVAPREVGMLRAIERATKQPIEPLVLPTKEAVANHRVAQFKQQVLDVINAEGLEFFAEVVEQLESEENISAHEIAAALAFMAQREKPLQLQEKFIEKHERAPRENRDFIRDNTPRAIRNDTPREFKRDAPRERPERPARSERPAASGGHQPNMVRYRIEVGRNQEVSPKDIVGAIANEGNLQSRYIGRIELYPEFSTVELPDDLPQEMLDVLKEVRVRRTPLDISLAGDDVPPQRSSAGERRPKKTWEGNRSERPAPGGNRPPFDRFDKKPKKRD